MQLSDRMKKTVANTIIASAITVMALLMCSCGGSMSSEGIVGNWRWVESSGGIAGVVQTPESTGETRRVVFEVNKDVTFYRNGEVTLSSTYTLGEAQTIFATEPVPVVSVEGSFTYAYSFPGANRLELNENVYDGFEHLYERE